MNEPQMNADKRRLNQITERIIGCAFDVGNELGCGFLEKCYENALAADLKRIGFQVHQQHPIKVHYKGECIGEYFADLLVEQSVIVELKATKGLDEFHTAQCMNYLRATGVKVCLLIHFGKKVEVKRFVNNL